MCEREGVGGGESRVGVRAERHLEKEPCPPCSLPVQEDPKATLCHPPLRQPGSGRAFAACPAPGLVMDVLSPPGSGDEMLISSCPNVCMSTGATQHSCFPVHPWTRSPPRGQEVLPTSASATGLVTCGH